MYFPQKRKNGGSPILDHWESSVGKKEIDEKPEFDEAGLSKMSEGGEVDMDSLKEIAKDILAAVESKSPGVLATALHSFLQKREEK
jgi:hypothetical protein